MGEDTLPVPPVREVVVGPEVAEAEFNRFADAMDLDVDENAMDVEDRASFSKHKRRLTRAIEQGILVINDDGEAVLTPGNKSSAYTDPITFHERTGAALMAMDGKKAGQDVRKMYAVMGELAKVHPSVFSRLAGSDIKICESLFVLLMD